jgi:hypothetical protein
VEGQRATSWWDFGPGFVRRVLITTSWLGAACFVCIGFYVGWPQSISWLSGVFLGLADLFLINALIHETITLQRKSVLAIYFVLKTVVLYVIGAVALFRLHLSPLFLLTGFSLFLLVVLLKVLGRMALSSRWMMNERKGPGGGLLRNSPGRRGDRS